MGKLILFLSFLTVGLLMVLSFAAPNAPIMWLASSSLGFTILRAVLMSVLLALLVTTPPRNIYFRSFVGVMSVGLVCWCLQSLYNNSMGLLDFMSFLAVGISAGIAVLERGVKTQTVTTGKRAVYIT